MELERLGAPMRQLRRHGESKLVKLGAGMKRFGFTVPVLIMPGFELITDVARIKAARRLGLKLVLVIRINVLSGPGNLGIPYRRQSPRRARRMG